MIVLATVTTLHQKRKLMREAKEKKRSGKMRWRSLVAFVRQTNENKYLFSVQFSSSINFINQFHDMYKNSLVTQ